MGRELPDFIPYEHQRFANPEERAREFYEHMNRRRSVRRFSAEPVDRSIIENAILTAGTSPNGAHMQPWHFVAVANPDIKREIRIAAEKEEALNYNGRLPLLVKALERLGTDEHKEYLEIAPWLIIVFAKMFHWEEEVTNLPVLRIPERIITTCRSRLVWPWEC